MAHESWEGLARILSGAKDARPRGRSFRNVSIQMREGALKGAEFDPIELHDVPQIGMKKKGSDEYEYISLEAFKALQSLDRTKYDVTGRNAFMLLTPADAKKDDERYSEMVEALKRLRIVPVGLPKTERVPKGEPIRLNFKINITTSAIRVYSKIAFNYLAHITSSEYVLKPAFDTVRNFIRKGTVESVKIHATMRFREPDLNVATAKQSLGRHIISIGKTNMGSDVSGFVMLYNTVFFKIKLCRFFPEIRHHPAIERHSTLAFNINKRSISRQGFIPEFNIIG